MSSNDKESPSFTQQFSPNAGTLNRSRTSKVSIYIAAILNLIESKAVVDGGHNILKVGSLRVEKSLANVAEHSET